MSSIALLEENHTNNILYLAKTILFQYIFADRNILQRVEEAAAFDPAYCPNQCGRFYKGQHRKVNLRRHIFECGVLPRYPCHVCQRRFFRKYQLKVHLVNVHKINPIDHENLSHTQIF